jgi:2-keto-3-deoxy-L-rhamnonate aldolase RhmA
LNASLRSLRDALGADGGLIATFLLIPRVEIVEMIGRAGFDAVVLDLEHGPIGPADVPGLAAAARGADLFAIARVPEQSPAVIAAVLDAGVDGVLVPHVGSVDEAQAVISAGRFPPRGERSINPYVRGLSYGEEFERGLSSVDERVALIVMLEGAGALDELESICAVPELDGVFIGPVDLSASLGLPGAPEHPLVVDAVSQAFRRARAVGGHGGVYAPTAEAAARWFAAGASIVAVSADAAMAQFAFSTMRSSVERLRERALETSPAD